MGAKGIVVVVERKAEVGQKSSGGLRVCHVSDFIMSREARLRCNASIIHLSYIVISFRLTVLVFIISIETTRRPDGVKEQVIGFKAGIATTLTLEYLALAT